MNNRTGDNNQIVAKRTSWPFSSRGMLAFAGALVVILALVIGLNVGGLREELRWRISPPRIKSIAILPFENLSRDPEQEYFANGMTQGLIDDMLRIDTFRLIGQTSAMRYKKAPKPLPEIARELKIDAVVQGGVLRSSDRVRISVNLVHMPTERHLWRQTFERSLPDILNLQSEVIRAIVREIRAGLTPQLEARLAAPHPVNPQAHDAFLRGWYGRNPAKRETYLQQAIQLDPTYAQAYNFLAQTYWMRNMYPTFAPRDTHPQAKEAAQKALSLDPDLPVAHRNQALVALEYDWNFAEAEKEFKRALELVPNGPATHHYYAHYLLSMGRIEEARAESRRAMDIEPLNAGLLACVSWHEIAARDYGQAERYASQALTMGAPDQLARLTLGWSYALRGRHDEAIAEFQKAVVGWKGAVFPTATLGHGYAVAGQRAAAREILDKLLVRSKTEYVSPYEIAVIYAGLGDKDRAFEWLEKAYGDRASLLVYFRMDPRIWSLRSDTRFLDLLRRMNFPQTQ